MSSAPHIRPCLISKPDDIAIAGAQRPDQKVTASVIATFKHVVKDGDLRLRPIVAKQVDRQMPHI